MPSRLARWLEVLRAGVTALGLTSCIAVLDPDAYVTDTGGATSGTSSRGAGAGGAGAGGAPDASSASSSASSSSGGGGSSGCEADLLSDPANCGACGWSCGPGIAGDGACVEGVCAAFQIVTSPTSYLAVLDGRILRASTESPVEAIEVRGTDFEADEPSSIVISGFGYASAKIARTETAVDGTFIVSSLNPVPDPQRVLFCDPDGLVCAEKSLEGDVVAGASPSSVTFAEGLLYWTFNTAETHLRSVDASTCLQGACALGAASGDWDAPASGETPASGRPSSLRKQVLPGKTTLWWAIHDFQALSEATTCVHAWDVGTDLEVPVPCVVEDTKIFTLVAAGPNVFYSTDVGGEGFIHRIVPDGSGWASNKITISLQHPLEVDPDRLFAYSGTNLHQLVAAAPESPTSFALTESGHVQLRAFEAPVHLDASDADYLIFTTCETPAAFCAPENVADQVWRLYRWRKPPVLAD